LLAEVTAPCDVLSAKRFSCPELIVGAAAHPEILGAARATERFRHFVIELEKGAGLAAAAVFGDVRALNAIAFVDLAAHGVGDSGWLPPANGDATGDAAPFGAAGADDVRSRSLTVTRHPRSAFRFSQALSFEILKQEVHGAFDDDGKFATRVRVTHEIAAVLELFPKRGARRKLDSKARH
jgi:hypothetical protein